MRRNGLSLRRKTSVAQKDPSRLIDKLVSYIFYARRFAAKYNYSQSNIIAMDETPVWMDMVSDTTVDKTGSRTVPFIVFKSAKREAKSLNEEFKSLFLLRKILFREIFVFILNTIIIQSVFSQALILNLLLSYLFWSELQYPILNIDMHS